MGVDSRRYLCGNLDALIPTASEHSSSAEVLSVLDFLLMQVELAVQLLAARLKVPSGLWAGCVH